MGPLEFADRTAIVTGGASGIGAATARQLGELGASVAIFDLNGAAAAEHTADLRANGSDCTAYALDVSDDRALAAAIAQVAERTGTIDLLVNCAASFISAGRDATRSDWDRVLSVNVTGYANTVSLASNHMPSGSAVVNLASISAHVAQPNRWTYNATKGAIVAMTKCQALDLSALGVRVNVVSPGWVWTPEVAQAAGGDRSQWEPVWGRYHMLRRLGEPAEIANAIVFLLSNKASFITGAELMVDGGYSALGSEGLGDDSRFASTSASTQFSSNSRIAAKPEADRGVGSALTNLDSHGA
jgi:NAD(P)-dependent dehydrogenase (short-subunit alcohol dehydrogenase family)